MIYVAFNAGKQATLDLFYFLFFYVLFATVFGGIFTVG
jgi:hypothetical protein